MTVEVDTVRGLRSRLPLLVRPARDHGSGQLDDKNTCASKLIGTGPFKMQD